MFDKAVQLCIVKLTFAVCPSLKKMVDKRVGGNVKDAWFFGKQWLWYSGDFVYRKIDYEPFVIG